MAFRYTVSFYDECEDKTATESGIITADSFRDAVEVLEFYYGANDIESIDKLEIFDMGERGLLTDNQLFNLGYSKKV